MPDARLTPLTKKNFLTSTMGVVGSQLFRHLYVQDESKQEIDVIEDGRLACAYVVSSLLTLYGFLDKPHATVATTLKKMSEYGWQETDRPQPGAVVYWPEVEGHAHIGIMIDNETCISNSSTTRTPVQHSLVRANGVKPTKFYIHPTLSDAPEQKV